MQVGSGKTTCVRFRLSVPSGRPAVRSLDDDGINPPPPPLVAVYTQKKTFPISKLRRLGHRPDLEVGAVLFQHRLAVVLPELLGGVLAGDALEDLGASGVLFEKVCASGLSELDGVEGRGEGEGGKRYR